MAEKNQPPPNPVKTDPEAPSQPVNNNPQKKKRRLKCYAILAFFTALVTIFILIFSLTYFRLAPPKVRLAQVTVRNSTTFIGNKRLSAQISVKNTNFLKYEFGPNEARLISGGVVVGKFNFPDAWAKARSTARVGISAEFSGPIGGGDVVVTAQGTLHGKLRVMMGFIRRRSSVMDCNFSVNFTTNVVQGLTCR
ncbi:hypothetical protein LguiA_015718 [Lonicera macranthoides]